MTPVNANAPIQTRDARVAMETRESPASATASARIAAITERRLESAAATISASSPSYLDPRIQRCSSPPASAVESA